MFSFKQILLEHYPTCVHDQQQNMEFVLNFVSLVSLAITAVMAVIAFILSRGVGKKCSVTDQLVLFWLIWDTMIHFCVVSCSRLQVTESVTDIMSCYNFGAR